MRVNWSRLSDDVLLSQCEWDRYRASGPGGQKRNKTDSAVRLRHLATGVIVTATESRSQHENRARAVRRLRAALALGVRQPITAEELAAAIQAAANGERWSVRPRDPQYFATVGAVLDFLQQSQGQVSTVAATAGRTTAQLVDLFRADPRAWSALNRLRAAHAQRPLR